MDKKIIKPKFNNILLKEIEEDKIQESNIIRPDIGNEGTKLYVVIAVGPGYFDNVGIFHATITKVGEECYVPAFGAQKLTYRGEEHIIIKENDLLASLEIENI